MRAGIFKCDNCNEEYRQSLRIGCLPPDWYTLTKGDNPTEKHFCCIECLIKWTSLQTVDSRKFDEGRTADNPPHMKGGEFKVTKQDCEFWRDN